MQKLFVFLLALIVLASSAIPCCPSDGCGDELTHSASQELPLEKGTCSPFFNCAGCSGFVQLAKPISISEPVTESPNYYGHTIPGPVCGYSSSFFQPPRQC